jgi:hypothetical protein
VDLEIFSHRDVCSHWNSCSIYRAASKTSSRISCNLFTKISGIPLNVGGLACWLGPPAILVEVLVRFPFYHIPLVIFVGLLF